MLRPQTQTQAPAAMSDVEDFYPLSPMQEGMLYETLYAGGGSIYSTQIGCLLAGSLDVPVFRRAWQHLLDRHPILRTFFVAGDLKAPVQVVQRTVELPFEMEDWRGVPESEQRTRLNERRQAERERGFDLAVPPLLRIRLFRMDEESHYLVWTFHHLLLDGWSVALVLGEIWSLYAALLERREPELPARRAFRDYIAWLRRQDAGAAQAFWQRELAGFKTPTPLIVDRDARSRAGAAPGSASIGTRLPPAETSALRLLTRRQGLTVNTLLQGVWALLLARYSGELDVVFGSGVSGRPADLEGAEEMIGMFVNTLPVRVRLQSDRRLVPWLQEIQGWQVAARQFEHSPLIDVQRWSEVTPGLALFESGVVFQNFPFTPAKASPAASGDGIAIEALATAVKTNVALTLIAIPEERLIVSLEYDLQRFDATTVRRALGHVGNLLAALAADPERRLEDLPLLTGAERQQLLGEWQGETGIASSPVYVHRLIEKQARLIPEQIAILMGDRTLTYGELDRRANQVARHLRAVGVREEIRVGLFTERSPEMLIGLLAILKAGGAYVPLDPTYPQERLEVMSQSAALTVMLTQERLLPILPERPRSVLCLDRDEDTFAAYDAEPLSEDPLAQSLAYIIYTSGSTGVPKGVLAEHGSLGVRAQGLARIYGFEPGDRFLQFLSLCYDASAEEIFPTLVCGATLVLHPAPAELSPADFLELCQESGVTTLHIPPVFWYAVIQHLVTTGQSVPERVNRFITGGEQPVIERLVDWHERSRRRTRFWNAYGPTEATIGCSCYEAPADVESLSQLARLPIGRPWPQTRIYVLDARRDLCPIGVPGELHVGGGWLTRGYLGRPDLTAESFLPDPFSREPGERMYKTGDLARSLADGRLELLGRLDRQIKVRGVRVEPGEVEEALTRHPGLREAAVVARKDAAGDTILVAYLVPQTQPAPAPAEVRAFLRPRLPAPMVPSRFVLLEALPLSANGKVDHRALPEPREAGGANRESFVEPEPGPEREIAGIWEDLLGVRPVGAEDDFFDLGGHSLLALRLVARLNQRLGGQLSLASVVEARTVRGIGALLQASETAPPPSALVVLQPQGSRPPLYCVHPVGGEVLCYLPLAKHLGNDQPFYGLQAPGLRSLGEESPSIEELALRYLDEVRSVQPQGPYLLSGWSFGAFVAFEMARRLEQAGDEISLLLLFDTWAPLIDGPPPFEDVQMLVDLAKDRAAILGRPAPGIDVEEYRRLEPDVRLERFLELLRREELIPDDIDTSTARNILRGYRSRRQAVERYQPLPYPGRITLFVGDQDPDLLELLVNAGIDIQDPTLGWGYLTSQPVEIHRVPGHHMRLFAEPNVQRLAEETRKRIDACLEQPCDAAVLGPVERGREAQPGPQPGRD